MSVKKEDLYLQIGKSGFNKKSVSKMTLEQFTKSLTKDAKGKPKYVNLGGLTVEGVYKQCGGKVK